MIRNPQVLACPICNYDYNHLLMTISFMDNDEYEATELIIMGRKIKLPNIKYPFRSQGNISLMFTCEAGHFFFETYDGHKGNMYINDNEVVSGLADYFNKTYKEMHKNSEYEGFVTYATPDFVDDFIKIATEYFNTVKK